MQQISNIREGLEKVPKDWKLIHLNEIIKINPESINKDYPYDEIEYIDIGSVENYQINKYEHFTIHKRPIRAQRIVRQNDIIVSTVRPYLHGFAKIIDLKPNLVSSTGFAVLRPHDLKDVNFIFNFIKSQYFESQLNLRMTGLAYPAVTSKIVGSTILGYPKNKLEVMKIGNILATLDELIQKTDQIIEQTQRLKKGLIQRLLTKGIGHSEYKTAHFYSNKISIPKGWAIIELKDFTTKIGSGITPRGGSKVYVRDGIPLIRSQNIQFDGLKLDDVAYITKDMHDEMSRTKLQNSDVLLNITGASIGRCTFVPHGFGEGNVNQHVCIIRPKDGLDSIFLSIFLSSELGQNIIFRSFGGLSREGLNFRQISSFQIPLPPQEEQKRIGSIVSLANLQIMKEYSCKLKMQELKKGLMQKLLTGKIRVKV